MIYGLRFILNPNVTHCRVFPLPPDSIYPYDSGQAGDAGITNNEPCVNRDNPACATYPSSTSRAAEYYLIPPYISINNCSLSESQLVQVSFASLRDDLRIS